MVTCHVERRRTSPQPTDASAPAPADDIVRQGLVMQQITGTVSAIEHLKRNAIDGKVIQRVLSGHALRAEDKLALQRLTDGLDA